MGSLKNTGNSEISDTGVKKESTDASAILSEDTESFIIGDRVWVGGIKPGVISYIGETQFGPGEWAGISLDEPLGKNDGSVAGMRYFQCEPKKGVFSRLTRLSRYPISEYDLEILAKKAAALGSEAAPIKGVHLPSCPTQRKITPTSSQPTSGNSLARPTSLSYGSDRKSPGSLDLKVGERVVIDSTSGIKYGVLRYLGTAEFAPGIWAGVELDEPTGKNDGSVAGKKVRRTSVPQQGAVGRSAIPSLRRSRSRESFGGSSVGSASASSFRPSRTSTYGMSPSAKAMQETLTEKTQHVEQLMRERDLERTEVSRMAIQLDQTSQKALEFKVQLDQLQMESEERIHDLEQKVHCQEDEKKDLSARLEDKQKEIDDLIFRLEEESLAKADFESQGLLMEEKVKRLEEQQEKKGRRESFTGKVEEIEETLRCEVKEMETKLKNSSEMNEGLTKKLAESEDLVNKLEIDKSSLSTSLNEKDQRIELLLVTAATEESRKLEEQSEEMRRLEEDYSVLNSELQMAKKDYEDVSQQAEEFLSDLETEKQSSQKIVVELNALKEKLKMKVELEEQSRYELQKLKEELQKSLEDSSLKSSEIEEERGNVNGKIRELTEEKEKLDGERSALLAVAAEEEKQKFIIVEELKALKEEMKDTLSDLGFQKEEKEKLRKQIAELEDHIELSSSSESHIKLDTLKLKEKERELIGNLRKESEKAKQLNEENEDLARKVTALEEEGDTLARRDTEREEEMRSSKEKVREKEEEIGLLKIQLELTSGELLNEKEEARKIDEQLEALHAQMSELRETESQHEKEAELLKQEATQLRVSFEDANVKMARVLRERDDKQEEESLTLRNEELEMGVDSVRNELEKLRVLENEMILKLDNLERKLRETSSELHRIQEENQRLGEDSTRNQKLAEEERGRSYSLEVELEERTSQVRDLEEERRKLKAENENLRRQAEEECEKFKGNINALQLRLQELSNERVVLDDLKREKEQLSTSNEKLLKELSDVKARFESELSLLKEDADREKMMTQLRLTSLERERSTWQEEMKALKEAVEITDNPSCFASRMKEERDQFENEVHFLNSVIVDLQLKKEELERQMQVLQLRGNVSDDEKATVGRQKDLEAKTPRLFCDICDCFDLHDTEDCVIQASDSPPSTLYQGSRYASRPYCDICEVFGHESGKCPEDETY